MIENSVLLSLLKKTLSSGGNTIPQILLESLLSFVKEHGGYIAGSSACAMYLENEGIRSFNPEDIDIYIPVKNSVVPHKLMYSQFDRNQVVSGIRADYNSRAGLINDVTTYGSINTDCDWIYITNKFLNYFGSYLSLYRIGNIESVYEGSTQSLYKKIVNFSPLNNFRLENDPQRVLFDLPPIQLIFVDLNTNIPKFINDNYDFYAVKVFSTFNPEMDLKNALNLKGTSKVVDKVYSNILMGGGSKVKKMGGTRAPSISEIFYKDEIKQYGDVSHQMDNNVKESKLDDTYKSQQDGGGKLQKPTLIAIDGHYLKNKTLNVPENWDSITLPACIKTVTNRFFKYTTRGFLPNYYLEHRNIDIISSYKYYLLDLKVYLYIKIKKANKRSIDMNYLNRSAGRNLRDIGMVINDWKDVMNNDSAYDEINKSLLNLQAQNLRRSVGLTNDERNSLKNLFTKYLDEIKDASFGVLEDLGKDPANRENIKLIEKMLNVTEVIKKVNYLENQRTLAQKFPSSAIAKISHFLGNKVIPDPNFRQSASNTETESESKDEEPRSVGGKKYKLKKSRKSKRSKEIKY